MAGNLCGLRLRQYICQLPPYSSYMQQDAADATNICHVHLAQSLCRPRIGLGLLPLLSVRQQHCGAETADKRSSRLESS